MKNRYTISEMAELLGVTTHMLRHYEKVGIIHPDVDEENGYRYYTVIDTRRFNLSRSLMQCGFSLEECARVMGDMPIEELGNLTERCVRNLRLEIERSRIAINYLQDIQDTFENLDSRVNRIWVENYPRMWRLRVSQNESAVKSASLKEQKSRWLSCLPAVRWVSRIPREEVRRFSSGIIEYDYGLMCLEEDALALGFQKTPEVEIIPGGDYLASMHRKTVRGPYTWEDIHYLTDYLQQEGITLFGDTYSFIFASRVEDGVEANYHKLFCKIYS